MKRLIGLEDCISHRLLLFTIENNLEINCVKSNYIHRLNNLCEINDYQIDKVKSKIMVRAYQGTIRYYNDLKK